MMKYLKKLSEALKASFKTPGKAISTVLISSITLMLVALSSNIEYSVQMVGAGMWRTALENRLINIYVASGLTGTILTVFYSILAGSALVNFYTRINAGNASFRQLSGILPGFLAAGCASCGVGVLALLGFAGALTALPFQGNLVKFGGIVLLIYYLADTGDPETCRV